MLKYVNCCRFAHPAEAMRGLWLMLFCGLHTCFHVAFIVEEWLRELLDMCDHGKEGMPKHCLQYLLGLTARCYSKPQNFGSFPKCKLLQHENPVSFLVQAFDISMWLSSRVDLRVAEDLLKARVGS